MSEILTTLEASRILERSVDRVRDYERTGRLPAIRTNSGQRLFRLKDVQHLAEELRKRSRPK